MSALNDKNKTPSSCLTGIPMLQNKLKFIGFIIIVSVSFNILLNCFSSLMRPDDSGFVVTVLITD